MTWLHQGNGYRCERHDEAFSLTSSCPACAADPGPPPDQEVEEPLPPAPPGCLSSYELEAKLVDDADAICDLIARLDPDGARTKRGERDGVGLDYHVANTIGKLYAERTKIIRAAMVCARAREDEVIVKRREKREREMLRGAPH